MRRVILYMLFYALHFVLRYTVNNSKLRYIKVFFIFKNRYHTKNSLYRVIRYIEVHCREGGLYLYCINIIKLTFKNAKQIALSRNKEYLLIKYKNINKLLNTYMVLSF
jgi:hypothetical protein